MKKTYLTAEGKAHSNVLSHFTQKIYLRTVN